MPWEEVSMMTQRREFAQLSQREEANVRELCRRFGVSPTTGYKWRERFRASGEAGLTDLPRRPHRSPGRTEPKIEELALKVRDAHQPWGGAKAPGLAVGPGS